MKFFGGLRPSRHKHGSSVVDGLYREGARRGIAYVIGELAEEGAVCVSREAGGDVGVGGGAEQAHKEGQACEFRHHSCFVLGANYVKVAD